MPTIETAFAVWQEDANLLDKAQLPDVQIPLIALAGVYTCVSEVPKNVYAFRKSITSRQQLCTAIAAVIPHQLRYEFEHDEVFPIDCVKVADKAYLRARQEEAMLLDGLPPAETTISSREYFLTRFLGQAAHNYTINLQPLRVEMRFSQLPLEYYFPNCLEMMTATL